MSSDEGRARGSPYAVSRRKAIQRRSGSGNGGHLRHHRRGTSDTPVRSAMGSRLGCRSTLIKTARATAITVADCEEGARLAVAAETRAQPPADQGELLPESSRPPGSAGAVSPALARRAFEHQRGEQHDEETERRDDRR